MPADVTDRADDAGAPEEHLGIPAGTLRRTTVEGLARLTVGGRVAPVVHQRLLALGLIGPDGTVPAELRPLGATVASPAADVELLRASAGDLAEVHGWWSPDLLLLHATDADPDAASSYVLTAPDTLALACLQALRIPDRAPAPTEVPLGTVAALLDVAREHGPGWADAVGAEDPSEVVLHRWDVAAPGRSAAVVRAVVSAPDGLRVLRHDDAGPVLVPTDLATEELELASVTEVLRAGTRSV